MARQTTRRRRGEVRREATARVATAAQGRTAYITQHFGAQGGRIYGKNIDAGVRGDT